MRLPQPLMRACLAMAMLLALGTVLPVSAQVQDLFKIRDSGKSAPDLKANVRLTPAEAKPGDEVTLTISLDLPDAHYVYSMNPAFGGATLVEFSKLTGLERIGEFTADHEPHVEFVKEFKQDVEKFTKKVVWSQKFRVLPNVAIASLTGELHFQVCGARTCVPHKQPLAASVQITGGTTAAPPPGPVFEARPGKVGKPQPFLFRAELIPPLPAPGEEFTLRLTATLEKGWHTYSLTQKPDNAAEATAIDLDELVGVVALDEEWQITPPHKEKIVAADPLMPEKVFHQEVHEGVVRWERKFKVAEDAAPEAVRLSGTFVYQVCSEKLCLKITTIEFELAPGEVSTIAAAPPATEVIPMDAEPPSTAFTAPPPKAAANPAKAGDIRQQGLLFVLGAAFAAGLGALFTPCVFPMIPITISYFLKQAEKQHHRPVRMAVIYCGSIIAAFTLLGMIVSALFGATQLNQLASGLIFNLVMAAVLVFFAMNLLGMFEIRIPSSLLTYTDQKSRVGGEVGLIFMALTFTLTTFTCTFAFLGMVLMWAANGEFWWPIAALTAFSTAFASPFFLLALFPSLLHKLPKSGGWMNRVKVIMGLLELAFVFKFLSVADIALYGQPYLFDFQFVLCAWMVLAGVAGAYLFGWIQFPHDMPAEHTGAGQAVVAMSFYGIAAYMAIGVFGATPPRGVIWENIAAFAPPKIQVGGATGAVAGSHGAAEPAPPPEAGPFLIGEHDGLPYLLNFESARAYARQINQPLFFDFTGVNCINCRKMEALMAKPQHQERLRKMVRVQLYTDRVPLSDDRALAKSLLEKNRTLQEEWFGDTTLPGYAVVLPDGQTILSQFLGMEEKAGTFQAFLDDGLTKWEQHRQTAATPTSKVQPQPLPGPEAGPIQIGHFDGVPYLLDFDRALAYARQTNRPLFLDFTAMDGCINLRRMEALVARPQHVEKLSKMVAVRLYTDQVPLANDSARAKVLSAQNLAIQENLLGDSTLPAYAVILPDGKTVLARHLGMEVEPGDFQAFLDDGLMKWEQHRQAVAASTTTRR